MKLKKLLHHLYNFNLGWVMVISLPIFGLSFFIFKFSSQIVFSILTLAALFYLYIATIHHIKDKTFRPEIMLEYILTATLALIIFYGLLL